MRQFEGAKSPPPSLTSLTTQISYFLETKLTPINICVGVVFDPNDQMWRCTICEWEVETFDGIQGRCKNGHESDLTRVEGWFGTCVWDNGMWSAESGEESEEEGGRKKRRRAVCGGEWVILPREGVVREEGDEVGDEGDEGNEGDGKGGEDRDSMEDFIDDSEVMEDGMGEGGVNEKGVKGMGEGKEETGVGGEAMVVEGH